MAIARKASDIGVHARTIEQSLSSLSIADRLLGGKEVILRQAAEEVRPLMRAMAQANFSASGIESRTGKLASAVARASIALVSRGLKMTLGDAPDYKSSGPAGTSTSVHRVGASLNYGAVHQPRPRRRLRQTVIGSTIQDRYGAKGILGDKAKRTLKKIALGQAVTQRSLSSLQQGIKGRHVKRAGVDVTVKGPTSKSVGIGDAVVLRPHPFFYFTAGQRAELAEAFRAAVQKRIDSLARRAG